MSSKYVAAMEAVLDLYDKPYEHERQVGLVRLHLPSSRGPAHRQQVGVSPQAQAWQVAESCPELAEVMAEIEFSVLARACPKG